MSTPIIEITGLYNILQAQMVHQNVNITINKNEIFGLIGGSGSGKTTILRNILMLLTPSAGSVKVFGIDVVNSPESTRASIRRRWGVMFQQGALFSGLTVLENIMFPIHEFAGLPKKVCQQLALLKLSLVGLGAASANKYPAELSGGMLKRVATARAIALDPELLILDEPTSGLDPKSTQEFDQLLLMLRQSLGLTIVVVSHDVDSLVRLTDRAAFLSEGKILAQGSLQTLQDSNNIEIKQYFAAYNEGRRHSLQKKSIMHPIRGLR